MGILGVLVVLGTALVIGVVIQRIYAKPAAPSMIAIAAPPAGEHVAGIAAAGDYVAVWETGPQGDKIVSINLATGAVQPVFSLPP